MVTVLLSPGDLERAQVELRGTTYRHLFRARRLPRGVVLRAADGRGRARWGEVTRVGRASASLVLSDAAPANEPPLHLELIASPPRPERAVWLVEKATELGAAAVRFVTSERSPRAFGKTVLERLARVAAAALEQCHRSRLPEVTAHAGDELEELLRNLPSRWVLDPGAAAPALVALRPAAPTAILVGPEGGWTDAERATLVALGCRLLGLGPRMLRIETAAVAAAAVLLCGWATGCEAEVDIP